MDSTSEATNTEEGEDEELETESPVTALALAVYRGAQRRGSGYSMGEFDRVGVPMFGGCAVCGASIAAYNACPSRSGYLKCRSGCISDDGYDTPEEADEDIFGTLEQQFAEHPRFCSLERDEKGIWHARVSREPSDPTPIVASADERKTVLRLALIEARTLPPLPQPESDDC